MLHRMLVAAALATAAAATPLAAAQGATTSKAKVTPGVFFGGVTAARYPVLIQLSRTGKKVVRASIGLELTCEMPGDLTLPDSFKNLPIKAGKFSNSYQETPDTVPDPATGISRIQFSGSVTGRLNAAKTTIKGTWSQKIVAYSAADPTGATVLYTCDSGVVNYTAKQ